MIYIYIERERDTQYRCNVMNHTIIQVAARQLREGLKELFKLCSSEGVRFPGGPGTHSARYPLSRCRPGRHAAAPGGAGPPRRRALRGAVPPGVDKKKTKERTGK